MHRVVIIGNGVTGVTAAQTIRRLKPTWRITLVSGESPFFYSRPALMYLYMGHMSLDDVQPYEPWYWEQQRIERVQDWVTFIDVARAQLHLREGGRLDYDELLLATGSKPNKFGWPGQDLEGVQGFYDLMDLGRLERSTVGLRRAVIVGGGLIGIELAECLHSRGAEVVMLVRERSYWNNVLPEGESRMVTEVVRESGIELRLETELEEIIDDGQGRVRAVRTKAGEEIDCQLVGLTAGVSPNLSAVEGSKVEVDRGIKVDEGFRTNVENIWSAGDCAEIVTSEGERNRIEQLWYTGKMHGAVVGRLMAGREARYDRGIWYNSAKFIDLEWQTYGHVPGAQSQPNPSASDGLYWEDEKRRHCLRIAHDDGVVRGMNALGIRHRHRVWERWIAEKRTIDYVLKHLGEACFDPEFFHRYESEITAYFSGQIG